MKIRIVHTHRADWLYTHIHIPIPYRVSVLRHLVLIPVRKYGTRGDSQMVH